MFKRIWDGGLSMVSGVVVLGVALVPAWFARLASGASLAPTGGYVFVAGLAFGAGLVALDFLKKGFNGVAPSRTRRRS
jgi:hypothetical protein